MLIHNLPKSRECKDADIFHPTWILSILTYIDSVRPDCSLPPYRKKPTSECSSTGASSLVSCTSRFCIKLLKAPLFDLFSLQLSLCAHRNRASCRTTTLGISWLYRIQSPHLSDGRTIVYL